MNAILQPQFFKRSTCHSATFYPVQLPHILEFEKKKREKKSFCFFYLTDQSTGTINISIQYNGNF